MRYTKDELHPRNEREYRMAQLYFLEGSVWRGDNPDGFALGEASRRYPIPDREVGVPRQREREG